MKPTQLAATLFAALALATTVSAHAEVSMQPAEGIQSNSIKFNGIKLNGNRFNTFRFNGLAFNGPGIILQGRTFNGPGLILQGRSVNGPGLVLQGRFLNGPGIVLQARNFNGFRMNGSEFAGFQVDRDPPALVSIDACTAPQPAREWPLSALQASSVKVRLAPR